MLVKDPILPPLAYVRDFLATADGLAEMIFSCGNDSCVPPK